MFSSVVDVANFEPTTEPGPYDDIADEYDESEAAKFSWDDVFS